MAGFTPEEERAADLLEKELDYAPFKVGDRAIDKDTHLVGTVTENYRNMAISVRWDDGSSMTHNVAHERLRLRLLCT